MKISGALFLDNLSANEIHIDWDGREDILLQYDFSITFPISDLKFKEDLLNPLLFVPLPFIQ